MRKSFRVWSGPRIGALCCGLGPGHVLMTGGAVSYWHFLQNSEPRLQVSAGKRKPKHNLLNPESPAKSASSTCSSPPKVRKLLTSSIFFPPSLLTSVAYHSGIVTGCLHFVIFSFGYLVMSGFHTRPLIFRLEQILQQSLTPPNKYLKQFPWMPCLNIYHVTRSLSTHQHRKTALAQLLLQTPLTIYWPLTSSNLCEWMRF